MKSLRLSAVAAALVLGACSSPTSTDPARLAPSLDEGSLPSEIQDQGGMLGSGDGTTDEGSETEPTRSGVGTMGSGG